ncbi:transcriptional regulator [Vibrio orientalis CIP 102891 = ATCC 33934]|uniref:Transcription regulator protein n=1 Tax=Vibrio orientalis CIP 102891 = ATCC 33934 TaxID=675816 RepID=C9QGW4_VIBOR|nr:LysR family transcriptional regulator [Vibrio orientalis]EEX93909.1 putative transcription regulator protein [Vibrio orientalis CIP 102891 = ATCC 33934]EGU48360.1 transcriptional regulator [Vibrio orientalis CIP 102891 = ATCC 33934]
MKSQLDLNLLKVLPLLDKHRQLKPVAKELGKTESAVSKHLAKLREQLDDQLFVRGAFEFEPTEYTVKLLPKISAGLSLLGEAVQHQEFDPTTYSKRITLALPSLAQYLVGKDLLLELMATFPQAEIFITTWSDASINDILDDTVDIGVQYFNEELTKAIYQNHIGRFKASIVCSNKYADRTLEDMLSMPYIMMEMKGWRDKTQVARRALQSHNIEIKTIAVVDNITCLFDVLDQIECATLLPNVEHIVSSNQYHVTVLPDNLQLKHPPSVVANYKLVNHGNQLHVLLAEILKRHLF